MIATSLPATSLPATDDGTPATPKGVVAIFTYPDGTEVASVSDFNQAGYGGYSLRQAQEMRAKRDLARAVIDRMCSPHVLAAMTQSQCDEVVNTMVRNQGFHRYIVPINYEPDDAK